MKCPKCGNSVNDDTSICYNCGMNLSFSTKETNLDLANGFKQAVTGTNTIKIVIAISCLIAIIFLFITSLYVSNNVDGLYINRVLKIVYIVLWGSIIVGIGLLIISIFLRIKKRKKASIITFIISFILIMVPIVIKQTTTIDGDITLTDYSQAEYIDIGTESIPSLYSVVGERKILFNLNNKGSNTLTNDMNSISIIYHDISQNDIDKYGLALIENGFKIENIESQEVYFKNKYSDNTYYAVSIDGMSITYSSGMGNYKNLIEESVR